MASVKHLWIVLDPDVPGAGLRDVCWKQDMSKLPVQMFGGGSPKYWTDRNLKFYVNYSEALADAGRRLAAIRRSARG